MSCWKSIRERTTVCTLAIACASFACVDAPREPTNRFHGRVVDELGSPVANARVTLDRFGGGALGFGPFEFDPTTQLHAMTGDDGTYSFQDVEPLIAGTLIVEHSEFAPLQELTMKIRASGTTEQPDARLARGGTVVGFVRDAAGRAVVNAVVSLPSSTDPFLPHALTPRTTTDANGAFVIEHVRADRSWVQVEATGLGTESAGFSLPPARDSVAIDLTLHARLSVAGTLFDDGGAPIASVELHAEPLYRSPGRPSRTRTDECGDFRLEGLVPGPWRLHVPSLAQNVAQCVTLAFDLRGVELRFPRFEQPTPRRFEGRVVDYATGAPVGECEVVRHTGCHGLGRNSTPSYGAVESPVPRSGRFALDASGTEREFEGLVFEFRSPEHAPTFVRPADLRDRGERTATVELGFGGALRGRVVDEDGRPVANAFVRARERQWLGTDGSPVGSWREFTTRATRRDGKTDGEGRFELPLLTPDQYMLFVEAIDHPPLALECVVERARATELGDLRFPRGATVRGRVVRPDGTPHARAAVVVDAMQGEYARSITVRASETGRFEVGGLAGLLHRFSARSLDARDPISDLRQQQRSVMDFSVAPGSVLEDLVLVLDAP